MFNIFDTWIFSVSVFHDWLAVTCDLCHVFTDSMSAADALTQDQECYVEHLICTKPLPTRYSTVSFINMFFSST